VERLFKGEAYRPYRLRYNNTESWKQLTGTLDQTDYAIEDNEWTIDEESETVVDLLEYLYNDESATIPSNYRTINVDEQAYCAMLRLPCSAY
jgi:hypothetical protein